jgi:putative peptide zinc metalloprotease protein
LLYLPLFYIREYLFSRGYFASEALIDKWVPKLKSGLEVSQQEMAGACVYIIKDLATGRFFRLRDKEYYIATLFDGINGPDEIAAKFKEKFGIELPPEQVSQFAEQLKKMGLMVDSSEEEAVTPQKSKRSIWGKLLFIKIKAFNPDNFIEKSYKIIRPFYTATAIYLYGALTLLAVLLTLFNIESLKEQSNTFFVAEIIPLIWITVFIVTIIHELSHTYACRLNGGKVTDMGFLLLYFQPCFYSNVSDAYLFPEKRKRIEVTIAGIISQIVVWALATLIWRVTSQDNWVNSMAFIIIALSFIAIAFNFNPLLKLDGYYFLVDYLDIPNLRQKAFLYIRQNFLGLAKGETPLEANPREKKIYRLYGTASLIYSGLLIGYIVYRAGAFINDKIGVIGVALLVFVILYLSCDAMRKGKIFRVLYDQRGEILKPRRIVIYSAVLLIIFIVLFIVHYPMRVTNECLTTPLEQIYLKTGTSTGLVELFVERGNDEKSLKQFKLSNQDYAIMSLLPALKVGDKVKSGDLIANIKSNVIEADQIDRLANVRRQKEQLTLLEKGPRPEEIEQVQDLINQERVKLEKAAIDLARAESLLAMGGISLDEFEAKKSETQVLQSELDYYTNQLKLLKDGFRPESIDMARAQLEQLSAKVIHSENQLGETKIETPFNGTVTLVNSGNIIIAVARTDTLRARIYVPEKEISVVKVGNPVKLKVRSFPSLTFTGIVTKIDPIVINEGTRRNVIIVTAHIANQNDILIPGMTGKAKINCGYWPIYKLILWRLVRYIRVEFWSWW